jgi:hypothetical protein
VGAVSAAAKGESWEEALKAMRGLLALTEVYPDFLPEALDVVDGNLVAQSRHRCLVEEHPCLRCGHRAGAAYLVTRKDHPGRRWFDACHACVRLLNTVVSEANKFGMS